MRTSTSVPGVADHADFAGDAESVASLTGIRNNLLPYWLIRFTIATNFTDPDLYLLGGGVTEAEPWLRDWFLERVEAHTLLRGEQRDVASFALVTDLDMAGARGSVIAALSMLVRR